MELDLLKRLKLMLKYIFDKRVGPINKEYKNHLISGLLMNYFHYGFGVNFM